MERKVFVVDAEEKGTRLDLFLTARGGSFSRSYWKKLCLQGNVLVDDQKKLKGSYRLQAGQRVEAWIPPPDIFRVEPEDIPLEVIYEDEDLLVVNKPRGQVVHPAAGHRRGTLVNALLAHCRALFDFDDQIRPGIVHRLDKDTTGLLVVAKNEPAFNNLSAQFKARKVKREYRALVRGRPPAEEGTIDAPLGRDRHYRKRMAIREDGTGRRSVTHYRVLKRWGSYALLSLLLETGRTHQIRVHLASIGCPVIGDPLYGPKKSSFNRQGQMLHARTLGFMHPRSKEYQEFIVEPGREFCEFLKWLSKREGKRNAQKTDHGCKRYPPCLDTHCP